MRNTKDENSKTITAAEVAWSIAVAGIILTVIAVVCQAAGLL